MKEHRERREQLEDDRETSKEYFLMIHTTPYLYAENSDQEVGEKLTMKKGKEITISKVGWKPNGGGLGGEQGSFICSKRRKVKNVDI